MTRMICHCFGHSEDDLRRDVFAQGRSLIMEQIIAEKRGGRCRCPETNPSGR